MKTFVHLFVFVVLIFTLSIFTTQDAHAILFTAAHDGDWNVAATWDVGTVPGSFDKVIIPSGVTVTVPSGLTVTSGSTIAVSDGGTLTNEGTINNFSVITVDGTINNNFIIHDGDYLQKIPGHIIIFSNGKIFNNEFGTISIDTMSKITINSALVTRTNPVGQIYNSGTIKNDGIIWIYGAIYNTGTINNIGEIDNNGIMGNTKGGTGTPHSGRIDNSGTINNFINVGNQNAGGKIANTLNSKIDNSGTINNSVGAIQNADASIITNTKTITNVGGTIENYCPSVINPMTVSAGNAIINYPCPIQLDPALMAWITMLSTIVLTVYVGLYSIRHPRF